MGGKQYQIVVFVCIQCEGRLLQWHPGATENKRRAIPAYNPDLLARFCKECSLAKRGMLPEIDMMDVGARQEHLAARRRAYHVAALRCASLRTDGPQNTGVPSMFRKGSGVICIAWHFRTIPSVSFTGGALVALLSK